MPGQWTKYNKPRAERPEHGTKDLEAFAGAGMAAVGIVGREGVGDFEADVEGGTIVDEFAALAISLHDGSKDTMEGKAIAGVGEHDEAFGAAL